MRSIKLEFVLKYVILLQLLRFCMENFHAIPYFPSREVLIITLTFSPSLDSCVCLSDRSVSLTLNCLCVCLYMTLVKQL